MNGVNKWIGIGNLGAAPELKDANGTAVCNLSVACNETWKDKSGKKQERVEWVRVSVFGAQAEACAKYLTKGSPVYVEGRLKTSTYEKNGEKRYSTDIVASVVNFLATKRDGAEREPGSDDSEAPF